MSKIPPRIPLCTKDGASPPLEIETAELNSPHCLLVLEFLIRRHLSSWPNGKRIAFRMIGSDSISRIARANKSPFGYVVGGTNLRPEIVTTQLEKRAEIRETSSCDSNCCFDTCPHDDGHLVVWRNGE